MENITRQTMPVLEAAKIPEEIRLQGILSRLTTLGPGERIELVAPHDPSRLLKLLLAQFPGRFDFAPLERDSRWRMHIEGRDTAKPRSVNAYLSWDHDRLDAILEGVFECAKRGDWQAAKALLADFRVGLHRHIELEDNLLFPEYEKRTGIRENGPTSVMRSEHVDIKRYLQGLVEATGSQNLDGMEEAKAYMLGVLVEHNMKEEEIVYPGTDEMLDDGSREAFVSQVMLR